MIFGPPFGYSALSSSPPYQKKRWSRPSSHTANSTLDSSPPLATLGAQRTCLFSTTEPGHSSDNHSLLSLPPALFSVQSDSCLSAFAIELGWVFVPAISCKRLSPQFFSPARHGCSSERLRNSFISVPFFPFIPYFFDAIYRIRFPTPICPWTDHPARTLLYAFFSVAPPIRFLASELFPFLPFPFLYLIGGMNFPIFRIAIHLILSGSFPPSFCECHRRQNDKIFPISPPVSAFFPPGRYKASLTSGHLPIRGSGWVRLTRVGPFEVPARYPPFDPF